MKEGKGVEQLKQAQQLLAAKQGPFVVAGRPHSGTRMLAAILSEASVFMGTNVSPVYLDETDWYDRFNFPIVTSRYFPHWEHHWNDPEFLAFHTNRMATTLPCYLRKYHGEFACGWKLGSSIFLMPLVKYHLPSTKFIHVIRDGRDVVLSDGGRFQLTGFQQWRHRLNPSYLWRNARHHRLGQHGHYYRAMVFNDGKLRTWSGINLTSKREITRHKFIIQMQQWINSVRTGRKLGAQMPSSYYEVRYEAFVSDPEAEAQKLFSWLGMSMDEPTQQYLRECVHDRRVGKWKTFQPQDGEKADLERALAFGEPLLRELGYAS